MAGFAAGIAGGLANQIAANRTAQQQAQLLQNDIAEGRARTTIARLQAQEAMRQFELASHPEKAAAALEPYIAALSDPVMKAQAQSIKSMVAAGVLDPTTAITAISHMDEQKQFLEAMKGQSAQATTNLMNQFLGGGSAAAGGTAPLMSTLGGRPIFSVDGGTTWLHEDGTPVTP